MVGLVKALVGALVLILCTPMGWIGMLIAGGLVWLLRAC